MSENLVYDVPKTITKESEGDFSFELNEIGELQISNKYEPTTFVLDGVAAEKLRQIIPIPLFQLHHQSNADDSTTMIAQAEIRDNKEMVAWHKDVAKRHPLPKDFRWLICNEKSKHFIRAADGVPGEIIDGT